jgi:hypothetical protein
MLADRLQWSDAARAAQYAETQQRLEELRRKLEARRTRSSWDAWRDGLLRRLKTLAPLIALKLR